MSMTADNPHERDASISWLNVKCFEGTAGLDPYDRSVVIVEVATPDRAWRIDLIGQVLSMYPHLRPNRSTCTRVHALIEADVRLELGLDGPNPPVMRDVALASRSLESTARAAIREQDKARGKSGR